MTQAEGLRLEAISKHFGGIHALTGVSLSVSYGEVLGIVGENGAGKSTLMKIVAGVMPPGSGAISLDGTTVHFRSPADAARLGIAMVYQDLALCDNLDAVANMFLGSEIVRWRVPGARRSRGQMRRATEEVLDRLGIRLRSLDIPVGQLSGGQRQAIAVGRAVMRDPKVVIFDEPTAALAVNQRGQVVQLIHRLREQGHAVLVVSHELSDVLSVSDRITCLRLGSVAAEFTVADGVNERDLVAAMLGVPPETDRGAGGDSMATANQQASQEAR
jgi:D-xylose transport system ATP-binding protein